MGREKSVTRLLGEIGNGERAATDELLPLVYDELRRRTLGEENYRTITSLGNPAAVLLDEGSLEQAGVLFQDHRRLLQKVLGDDHPSVPTARQRLVILYQQSDRPEKAAQFRDSS